ncbi:MAG: hypothetical protein QOG48_261 [Verrucomicrobiota bacterium]|jgi:uncharacterized membrane protein YdbT with pleckstrin-like domain
MAEETVWRGTSSQWKNFGRFVVSTIGCIIVIVLSILCARAPDANVAKLAPFVLVLLIVPIFMALARYLQTKNKIYELTSERLKITEGVFSKATDTLELYRVKDMETRQPFTYRMVGLENVHINTSDTSTPFVLVDAIPARVAFADKLRNAVEAIRAQKGVREIDIE